MNNSSSQTSKIPQKLLLPVRLAWIIIAVFQVTVFLITLPGEMAKPATFEIKSFSGEDWTPEEIETSARELGISIGSLANFAKALKADTYGPFLFFAVGLLIFIKKSDDWVAISISLILMMFYNRTNLIPAFGFLTNLNDVFTTILLPVTFMIFPDGRFVPKWVRWVAVYTALVQIPRIFYPQEFLITALALTPTFFLLPHSLIYRYRRIASPVQRLQIKWVIFINGIGFGLMGLLFLTVIMFPALSMPGPASLAFFLAGGIIWSFFMIMLPLSFAIAILRSHLWDIDVIIRKTLVYTLLTGLLGLTYFGVVALLQGIVTTDRGQLSPAIIVATTLAIYVLFNPLRRRLQDFIDRRFYRQKYDAEKALAEFASAARSETDLAQLSNHVTNTVNETIQPEKVSLWLVQEKKGMIHGR